jgi:hypothetical protein
VVRGTLLHSSFWDTVQSTILLPESFHTDHFNGFMLSSPKFWSNQNIFSAVLEAKSWEKKVIFPFVILVHSSSLCVENLDGS